MPGSLWSGSSQETCHESQRHRWCRSDGQNNQSMGWSCRTDGSGDMLAHQLRWQQQQQQPFALTWCWMQCFVAVEQQFVYVGWVGNEEGFIEWRARRAGDDIFGPLDFGAGSPGPRMRHAIMGTMETDVGAQTTWLLESMHLGGGGGVGRWRR